MMVNGHIQTSRAAFEASYGNEQFAQWGCHTSLYSFSAPVSLFLPVIREDTYAHGRKAQKTNQGTESFQLMDQPWLDREICAQSNRVVMRIK